MEFGQSLADHYFSEWFMTVSSSINIPHKPYYPGFILFFFTKQEKYLILLLWAALDFFGEKSRI